MPVSKKRKTAATSEEPNENSTMLAVVAPTTSAPQDMPPTTMKKTPEKALDEGESVRPEDLNSENAGREQERQERFKALQARAVSLQPRMCFVHCSLMPATTSTNV